MTESERYDAFVQGLKDTYPEMYEDVNCGIYIGEGWYKIINQLSDVIHTHVKWNNQNREYRLGDSRFTEDQIPEFLEYPRVRQIKEKFGGLRFYCDGGDDYIDGAIVMAEMWAANTCEKCGEVGTRRAGGWIRTLCDKHEDEYQKRNNETD